MRNGLANKVFIALVLFCSVALVVTYIWTETKETSVAPPRTSARYGSGKRIRVRKLPGCLLIGARKGGTRALIDMLSLHTRIKVTNEVFRNLMIRIGDSLSVYFSKIAFIICPSLRATRSTSSTTTPTSRRATTGTRGRCRSEDTT